MDFKKNTLRVISTQFILTSQMSPIFFALNCYLEHLIRNIYLEMYF